MPRPRALRQGEAARTLAHRLASRVDRVRQLSTRFGVRSRRLFLVWTRYTGHERGEGEEQVLRRVEILPTPKVSELTAITMQQFSLGILPVGSVRVTNISAQFAEEELLGKVPPAAEPSDGNHVREPFDFYYEMVEDQRESAAPARAKFRLYGNPTRDEGNVSWTIVLERVSEDARRDGSSNYGSDD